MPPKRARPPLLFITQGPNSFASQPTSDDAFAIASHITSRYNRWSKANRKSLLLDSTTKAILSRETSSGSPLPPGQTTGVQVKGEDGQGTVSVVSDVRVAQWRGPIEEEDGQEDVDLVMKSWTLARREFERFVHVRLVELAPQFLDPFSKSNYDSEVTASLYFYFKIVQPFATHLIPGWEWIDNLPQIQSSPLLAYALATYTTVFKSGMLRGGPGVVIPPAPARGSQSPWPMPPWLRLHTKCLAELNALLSRTTKIIDDSCYQAILFLYRLSVLLADGETGRMHHQALRRIIALKGLDERVLEKEMTVSRVNIIGSFLHHDSVFFVRYTNDNGPGQSKEVVELDRSMWSCDREWYSHRACLAGRELAWRAESPGANLLPHSAMAIHRMDLGSWELSEADFSEIRRCYQIAVFFWVYLNAITFNTGALIIRANVLELQNRLCNMNLDTMSSRCYTTLFNILIAGTNASRGQPERWWFIDQIINLYPRLKSLDNIFQSLAQFYDPLSVNFNVLEDIWDDICRVKRRSRLQDTVSDNCQMEIIRPIKHTRPTTYTPDLTKRYVTVEIRDDGANSAEEMLCSLRL